VPSGIDLDQHCTRRCRADDVREILKESRKHVDRRMAPGRCRVYAPWHIGDRRSGRPLLPFVGPCQPSPPGCMAAVQPACIGKCLMVAASAPNYGAAHPKPFTESAQ